MQKEFEKHEVVKNMTEDEKKKYEIKVQQLETKHKEHAPVSFCTGFHEYNLNCLHT